MNHGMQIDKNKQVPKEFKDIIHVWRVPLYGIHIYYSCDDEAMLRFKDIELRGGNSKPAGFCTHEDGDVGIYVRRAHGSIELPTMSHEIFHASMAVAELIGLDPTTENNESVAYIITWMTDWVLQCAKKDKKRLND